MANDADDPFDSIEFPDDEEPKLEPFAVPAAPVAEAAPPVAEAPPPPPKRTRKPKASETVSMGEGPEVTVKFKQPKPPAQAAPPPPEPPTLLELLGGTVEGQVTVFRDVCNGNKTADIGWCGELSDKAGSLATIQGRWGGGVYRISGKVNGKTEQKNITFAGDSKPIAQAAEDDDDLFFVPPSHRYPAGYGTGPYWNTPHYAQPVAPYAQQQSYAQQHPYPQQYGNGFPGGAAFQANNQQNYKELEEAKIARVRAEEDAKRAHERAEYDAKITKAVTDGQKPTVDPLRGLLEIMQSQMTASQQRYDNEARERRERDDKEANERRERDERLEKDRQAEALRRDNERKDELARRESDIAKRELERKEEFTRREAERKEERDRQEKFFAHMSSSNDPKKFFELMALAKTTLGGDDMFGQIGKLGKAFDALERIRGEGGPKSEMSEKVELVESISKAAGGALREVAPTLQEIARTWRGVPPSQGLTEAQIQQIAQERVRQQAIANQRRKAAAEAAARQAQAVQQPSQPSSPPQPVQPADTTAQQIEAAKPKPPEDPDDASALKHMALLRWILKAYGNQNDPVVTANATRIFAAGAASEAELLSIVETPVDTLKLQLSMLEGGLEDGEPKLLVTKLRAIVESPDGGKWFESVLAAIKRS